MIVIGLFRIDGALISLGAAGLLLALLTLLAARWNLTGLKFHLTAPRRVFANTPFNLRLSVLNQRALFGSWQLTLDLHLSKSVHLSSYARWTAARSASTSKILGAIPNRGAVAKHPCLVTSTFPLGLFCSQKQVAIDHEILVFPQALVPREFLASGQFDDAWEGEGDQASDAPGEPRGLRPYQPGDRAKQIHWPATIRALARGRDPRVREYDPPGLRPRRASVIFHSFGTDHTLIRTDLFERALALVCGTLRHFRAIGVPTNLVADFLFWKPQPTFQTEAWSKTLPLLAHATRADHTEAHDLLTEIESAPSDHALVVISDMPLEAWKHVIPDRPLILIDIRQHQFKQKDLNLQKPAAKSAS